jgi:hypothetical protein
MLEISLKVTEKGKTTTGTWRLPPNLPEIYNVNIYVNDMKHLKNLGIEYVNL